MAMSKTYKSWIAISLKLLLALFALLALALSIFLYVMFGMPGRSIDAAGVRDVENLAVFATRLKAHVEVLADDIGERNPSIDIGKLNLAANYIHDQLQTLGYVVNERIFGDQQFRILSVELTGSTNPDEFIVAGAHYDTTIGSPGADDNASGVAVLLEIARELHGKRPARSIRLIMFPNEERPYGRSELGGSYVSARDSADKEEKIIGMMSLEMLGYFSDEAGSQRYPSHLSLIFPDRANRIFFASNLESRYFLRQAVGHFREQAILPSDGAAMPRRLVRGIDRSDHRSYWRFGYPAILVTDGAEYRNPNYHQQSDLPGTLDYQRMARVMLGLASTLEALAQQ
jgi:Zn-dependent M28 family amino/carboxypeptidase